MLTVSATYRSTLVRGIAGVLHVGARHGRMAKLAPDSIRLETPSAIVGVRGTTVAVRVAP